jgi:hypothetical protein
MTCINQLLMSMMSLTTFNNISVISWRSVLLVEETWVPGENHVLLQYTSIGNNCELKLDVFYIVIYRNYYKILMSFSVWYFSKVMSLSRILFLLLLGRKDEKKCTIQNFNYFFHRRVAMIVQPLRSFWTYNGDHTTF